MESKSKSQMRRFEAQIPDYKALMRVVRAAEKARDIQRALPDGDCFRLLDDALHALPEHLRGEG